MGAQLTLLNNLIHLDHMLQFSDVENKVTIIDQAIETTPIITEGFTINSPFHSPHHTRGSYKHTSLQAPLQDDMWLFKEENQTGSGNSRKALWDRKDMPMFVG